MRIASIVGNRPQFVKAAAVSRVLREEHDELLVHTGQHYDDEMSRVFFDELGIPAPDRELHAGSGKPGEQTARILERLEPELAAAEPDMVLVYGDTNSTLAASIAAAQARIPLAHVEAGMRSFDRAMPEELNRVVSDRVSDLLLCSTPAAVANLEREGITGGVHLVGDVMADVCLQFLPIAEERGQAPPEEPYILMTVHRAGNVDDPARLAKVADLCAALPGPVLFPVHPRTRARLEAAGLEVAAQVMPPLGYLDFLRLARHARAVVTDSGGVQKEAYLLETPCVTLRDTTEWVETVDAGWNVLVDLDTDAALAALERDPPTERPELYGGGRAAERIGDVLRAYTGSP